MNPAPISGKPVATSGRPGMLLFSGQQRIYHEIAKFDFIKTICDSGFNAGYSAFTWLNSSNKTKLYTFAPEDNMYGNFSKVYNILKKMFPGRFKLTTGGPAKTLPQFQKNYPEIECNLVVMGNTHRDIKTPQLILRHFEDMIDRTYPYNLILVEDWTRRVYKVGGSIWEKNVKSSNLGQIFRCTNSEGMKILSMGWYP